MSIGQEGPQRLSLIRTPSLNKPRRNSGKAILLSREILHFSFLRESLFSYYFWSIPNLALSAVLKGALVLEITQL